MTWNDLHRQSTEAASMAEQAQRGGHSLEAEALYGKAAIAEKHALDLIPRDKPRTLGIIAVSAAALFFKGKMFREAEAVALKLLSEPLPEFARRELQTTLQAVWNEEAKVSSEIKFMPGHVFVSVSGGEVVTGGAPLDLILEKVQAVRSLFVRTVEYVADFPHRRSGPAKGVVLDALRPWIFQAPAGSYQFAIAIQGPSQPDFFKDALSASNITDRFLEIVDAASSQESEALSQIVPDEDYRRTFVQLTRNLLPRNNRFEELSIYSVSSSRRVQITREARQVLAEHLDTPPSAPSISEQPSALKGTLRALDLDRDWLDVVVDGKATRVRGLQDTVNDVIGPMVNRTVIVRVRYRGKSPEFVNIELDD